MSDITILGVIEHLVNAFYKKVVDDTDIAHFFTEAVPESWECYVPIMISPWETLLLDRITFRGIPMEKYINLHRITPLQHEHFHR